MGHAGSLVIKALSYKPEGRVLETQWGEILNLSNPSGRTGIALLFFTFLLTYYIEEVLNALVFRIEKCLIL
jgi:hypothetical protein